jgi:hypothetical protein
MHDYRNIIVHHQDIKGAKGLYMGEKRSVSAAGLKHTFVIATEQPYFRL